ncbi:hypothetical protein pdam_00024571, partial [Pocillopora damicornis]
MVIEQRYKETKQRGQPVLTSFISFLYLDEWEIVGDERPGFDANKKINKESSGISQMDNEMPTIMIQTELRLKESKLIEFLREDDMDRDDVAS